MALDAAAIRRDESLRRADRESLAERYANDAMASLSRCRVAGFFRLPIVHKQMERDRDLDSLLHETTASGRVTRRASSDPACLLRAFVLATAFGERGRSDLRRAIGRSLCPLDIHAPNGGYST